MASCGIDALHPVRASRTYLDFERESFYGFGTGNRVGIPVYSTETPLEPVFETLTSFEARKSTAAVKQRRGTGVYNINGMTYLYGGSTPFEVLPWMTLLEACGFRQSVTPLGIRFTPHTYCTSLSVRTFYDNFLHTSPGCRGNFTITTSAAQPVELQFGLVGQYRRPYEEQAPADVTVVPGTFARACSVEYTMKPKDEPAFQPVIKSFSFSPNHTLATRTPASKSLGDGEVYIASSAPTIAAIIEMNPAIELMRWYEEETPFTISWALPTSGGATLYFETALNACQFSSNPAYTVDDGLRVWNLQFSVDSVDYISIEHH